MQAHRTLNPVRWGIVGPGRIVVTQIAPALRASPTSTILGCAGSSLEKSEAFARQFGAERCYPDYKALVADPDIDAVFIATPNELHRDMVLAAAHAGKHVLCEKPLALTVRDGEAMVEACARAGVLLRVGFYIRLEAIMARMRALLQSNAIGEPRAVSLSRTGRALLRAVWRLQAAQGGALFDMAVHLLDLVEWLTGKRFAQIAASSHPDRKAGLADDTIAILGALEGGCQVQIRASRETPHAANDLVIEATDGMAATSALRWADRYDLSVTDAAGVRVEQFAPTPGYALELQYFEREMRGESCGLPTGADGVRAIRLAEAVAESIAGRRIVPV